MFIGVLFLRDIYVTQSGDLTLDILQDGENASMVTVQHHQANRSNNKFE